MKSVTAMVSVGGFAKVGTWVWNPSENHVEPDQRRSRLVVAVEGNRGRSWNSLLQSNRS